MRLFQLVSTFWAALARDRPFSHSPLVVGVSGGPDSLALLHLLHRLLPANRLVVAHLDHGLRPEAAADARFVAETAAAWGMACVIQAVDVAALAAQQQLSLEAAGRQARYAFFARVAQQAGAEMVAVGHNADDQAETVLMHLIRGAGPAGLRGMQPVSPLVGVLGVWLLRPLLNAPRAAIDAYCHAHDLQPRHDLTNQDPRFFRNRIRHELLPLLESYNPGIHSGLLQLASILTAEDALLQAQQLEAWQTLLVARGADWLRLDRSGWRALPVALQRRLLRHAVAQLRPDVSDVPFDAVEQARLLAESADTGAASVLPGGLVLRVAYETIFIGGGDPVLAPGPQLEDEARRLPIPGVLTLANGWQLRAAPAAEAGLGSARD
ncbi:MAG: tRNA lysidine(34) synthetase TilS, partial [Anaerolineales bacterium]|nr:tRNA lysidine(34) synthetase TilS [Anaerolineales bacterium]